ncbi:hypothetical protein DU508_10935 [Pedobacter chinensis]|uniref:Uncharacterized protein n=1 Tax=Pedobacter chinensis TaxID=2282421 RepID=A0A369PV37_9SPHI|nr:hypothetical protein DU508_10935 [Pedobacter chinensis]
MSQDVWPLLIVIAGRNDKAICFAIVIALERLLHSNTLIPSSAIGFLNFRSSPKRFPFETSQVELQADLRSFAGLWTGKTS